jgi:hypothetical protein
MNWSTTNKGTSLVLPKTIQLDPLELGPTQG